LIEPETNRYMSDDASDLIARRVPSDSTGGASYALEMPVDAWIALPDHPRQRDTLRQAAKGHWKLARRALGAIAESHRWVIGADLEGKLYKVDGHTRALLWRQGKLKRPASVYATVYRCKTRAELIELYGTFDSQAAVEKQQDRVTGAMRQLQLHLKSKRLRYGAITDALSIAVRGVARGKDAFGKHYEEFDVYEAMEAFAPELRLLDAVDPQPEIFHTGVVAAALLTLALDSRTIEFFLRVSKPMGGRKEEPPFDPMHGIRWLMKNTRKEGTGRAKITQEAICGTVLGAIELWRGGEKDPKYWVTNKIDPPGDVLEAVRRVRELKSLQMQRT
jgi:hypothetical protein